MLNDNAETRVIEDLRAEAGTSAPGERLSSVRELMARHRASPVTVQRAIAALAAEGLLEPRPGRGTFVAPRAPAPVAPDLSWQAVALGAGAVEADALHELLAVPAPGAIPLSSGYLSLDLQPINLVGAALARAARRPGAWERGPVEGREELRAWFAREAGGSLRAHDVVVCSGGQPALATAFRALAAPGDPVLVEAPTYLGAIVAARAAGLRVIPVPSDADGVRPDLLAQAFARTGARLVYCQPLYANPHGSVLAADRRRAVLDAVAARRRVPDRGRLGSRPRRGGRPAAPAGRRRSRRPRRLRALADEVGGARAARGAAIGARGAAGARLRAARIVDDFFVSGPLQEAALEVVSAPGWRAPPPAAARRAARAPRRARGRPAAPPAGARAGDAPRPAACTCGSPCPRAPTTSPWRPPRRPRAWSSSPAARGSRPIRPGRSCA